MRADVGRKLLFGATALVLSIGLAALADRLLPAIRIPHVALVVVLTLILLAPIVRKRIRHSPHREMIETLHTMWRPKSRSSLWRGIGLIVGAFVWPVFAIVVIAIFHTVSGSGGTLTPLGAAFVFLPFFLLAAIGSILVTRWFAAWILGRFLDSDGRSGGTQGGRNCSGTLDLIDTRKGEREDRTTDYVPLAQVRGIFLNVYLRWAIGILGGALFVFAVYRGYLLASESRSGPVIMGGVLALWAAVYFWVLYKRKKLREESRSEWKK